jgi:hypothetical protein
VVLSYFSWTVLRSFARGLSVDVYGDGPISVNIVIKYLLTHHLQSYSLETSVSYLYIGVVGGAIDIQFYSHEPLEVFIVKYQFWQRIGISFKSGTFVLNWSFLPV